MKPIQKGVLVVVSWLVSVFALSVALGWYSFGYLDGRTVMCMFWMLVPVLVAAALILALSEKKSQALSAEKHQALGGKKSQTLLAEGQKPHAEERAVPSLAQVEKVKEVEEVHS